MLLQIFKLTIDLQRIQKENQNINQQEQQKNHSTKTLMKRLDSGQQQMVQQLMQQVLMYFGMHIQHYQTFMLGHMNLDTIKIAEYFC